jgi:Polysaccharide deacetylase
MKSISLMYHDVVEERASGSTVPLRVTPYSLSYRHFRNHLESIGRTPAVSTIQSRQQWSREIPIFLTFDDGELSAYTHSAAALEDHGWRGHFFVTTNWIGQPGFLNRDQILELRNRGHVIGSHSCSHPERMSHLSESELVKEWSVSREILSEILSEQVRVASVPAGFYSRKVGKAAARGGIEVLFTSEPTSEISTEDGCLILGRYCIQGHMPARSSGEIANGLLWPRLSQSLIWQTKKAIKAMTGERYFTFRSSLLTLLKRQK